MLASARLVRISPYVNLAKMLVLLLTLYFLYQTLQHETGRAGDWFGWLLRSLLGPSGLGVVLAGLLIPLNWGLEAGKWRLLAQKLEPVSFSAAFRAVMAGLTLGFVTPNRLGDYAGRILEMDCDYRVEAIGAVFLGRVSQLLVTVLLGSGSLLFLSSVSQPVSPVLLWCGLGLSFGTGFFLMAFFTAPQILLVIHRLRFLRPLLPYIKVIGTYSRGEVVRVLGFAFGRYLVFSLQFALLLQVFGIDMELAPVTAAIAGTFLLKSVLPSFNALGDLGLREVSAIMLFGYFGQPHLPVLAASFSLWLLNIGVPSLVGLLFVFRLKLKS